MDSDWLLETYFQLTDEIDESIIDASRTGLKLTSSYFLCKEGVFLWYQARLFVETPL